MAQLLLTVGGQVIGGALGGPIGAAIGGAVGAYAYNALFGPEIPDQYGPSFGDAQITSSAYGQVIPVVYGTMPVAGNIIDASGITVISHTKKTGGKDLTPDKPKVTTYTHYADIDVLVADATDGPVSLLQIYANGRLWFDATPGVAVTQPSWLRFTWYDGTQTIQDPTFEALRGVGNVPAYNRKAHCVFRQLQLDELGLSDSIAINFRFVVSRNGTNSIDVDTIDLSAYESTANDILDIEYAPYSDVILVALGTSAGTTTATHTIVGVNPYTRDIAFKRNFTTSATSDGNARNLALCSIPVYTMGVQVNPPGSQVVYSIGHSGTTTERIEVMDVDTGVLRVRATISDINPPHWFVAPNLRQMTLYRMVSTGLGTGNVKRMTWGGDDYGELSFSNPWTDASVTRPSGWDWDGNITPPTDGEGTVLFLLNDSTPGVLAINDGDLAIEGDIDLSAYEPTDLTAIDGLLAALYDETQDCFWIIGSRSADSNMQLYKIDTDGVVLDQWNMYSDIGITGTASWSDMEPGIDTARGRLVFGFSSNYYSVSTTSPESGAETYSMGTSTVGVGVMHAATGRFYTGQVSPDEEIMHAVRLSATAAGTMTLEDVCDEVILWGDTHIASADVDNSALSGITVRGCLVGRSNMSKASVLNMLMSTYLFDIVPRDGVLTAVLRGTESSAQTLTEHELGAYIAIPGENRAPPPIEIIKASPEELPRSLTFNFVNPNQNWETGSQPARRLASPDGVGTTESVRVSVSLTDEEAAQAADVLLHMRHIESIRYKTRTVPSTIGNVAPAKVVTLDYDAIDDVVRVERGDIVEGMIVDAVLVRSDASAYTSYSVGGDVRNTSQSVYSLGSAAMIPMQLPALRDTDFDAGYYVAAYSYTSSWPGCEIFRSTDGVSYAPVGAITQAATVGIITSISGTPKPVVWDSATTLTLALISGDSLSSSSFADVRASKTLNAFAIGRDGRWVLGRYLTATDHSDGTWTLSGLVLGLQGTEQSVSSLTENDKLVLLEENSVVRVTVGTDAVGGTDYLKAVTLGRNIYDVVPHTIVPTGEALKPFAPHSTHAQWSGSDIVLSWVRCDKKWTRAFWNVANSEASESYTVAILDVDGNTARTLTSGSESVTYTGVQQTADFGAPIGYIRWKVAQVSADVGAGTYNTTESGRRVNWQNTILGYSPIAALAFTEDVGAGTLADYSGNGYDATNPDNYSLLRIPGPFDFGIDLSAASDFGDELDFGTVTALNNANSSDFSLVFLIEAKPEYDNGDIGQFIKQTNGINVYFVDDSGELMLVTFVRYSTTSASFYTKDFTLTAGEKTLFVVTHNSSAKTSKIYVSGAEVGSYSTSTAGVGTAVNGTSYTRIGGLSSLSYLFEWALIPSELSSAQVAALNAKLTE